MAAWGKWALGVLVVLMPGGFLLALAYAFISVLREAWRAAQLRQPEQAVTLRTVLAQVTFRDVVRVARMH